MENPLIEYRSALEGKRQIFWLNHADAFHAFAQIDEHFSNICKGLQVGRDGNKRTRPRLIPLILFIQRQSRSAFDLFSTYRGYEAWIVIRPAIELALMLGKFEDDLENLKVWERRDFDRATYRKTFSGKKLKSMSLPRSAEIQQVLRSINDKFVHANPEYFGRHATAVPTDAGTINLRVSYTDNETLLTVQLWSFLHVVLVIQECVTELLNHTFVNTTIEIASVASFEAHHQERRDAFEKQDGETRAFVQEIGLWEVTPSEQ